MNRKVATGCGIALALFAIAVAGLVYIVPKLIRKGVDAVKDGLAEAQRAAAFEATWTPPSPSPDASWFPKEVGKWSLTTQEPSTGIPRLNIERPGQYAAYRSGGEVVEVNVIAANDLEKDALFQRAQEGKSGSSTVTSRFGNQGSMRLNGDDYTRLWWMPKGWLFIFHNHGGTDPEKFMEPFLEAMEPGSSEAPARLEGPPALK
jgi:hypothetical protein